MVANNQYGISTNFATTSADKTIAARAIPYGIRAETVDGNDPVVIWNAIDRAMRYCRRERKPFLLEAMVSRLHGHSSSSGAQRNWNEADVLALFEQRLIDAGATDTNTVKALKDDAKAEADGAVVEAMQEPEPTREDVLSFTYAPSSVDAVYPRITRACRGRGERGKTNHRGTETQRRRERSSSSKLSSRVFSVSLCLCGSISGTAMATIAQAVRMALHYGEEHLGVTDVFGEDVGPPLGGVFTVTQGLKNAWNTPLDERGILGTAMGIAYAGGRPICEIQFCDYAFNVMDMLKIAGNQRWASGGGFDMPMVVMTPTGAGIRAVSTIPIASSRGPAACRGGRSCCRRTPLTPTAS